MRKVTIKDVAKEAGVSYATVSRALSGRNLVNALTKKRIIEAAELIGYRPNGIARSLVSRHSNTIALIVPDISNPFFADMALALEDAAMNRGYNTILCNTRWNTDIEDQVLNMVEEKCVDGIVIKPARYDTKRMERIAIPTVMLTHDQPKTFSYVEVENEKGGFIGCEHLIQCGYRQIAFIGGDRFSCSNHDRMTGYIKALKQNGRPVIDAHIRFGPFTVESGYINACSVLSSKNPPDAFMCGNDLLALGVWQRVSELGLRVPEDVGICGFDNSSTSELPQIQLTSIDQPRKQMGEHAANILIDAINNRDENYRAQKSIFEPCLIKRSTTRKYSQEQEQENGIPKGF